MLIYKDKKRNIDWLINKLWLKFRKWIWIELINLIIVILIIILKIHTNIK